MKKSRFTETQLVSILKQYDGGTPAADLCREHGICAATLYSLKKQSTQQMGLEYRAVLLKI